ncbi:glycoside hydrolase family 65 protein [Pseudogracilibacillus auburnensis]|uniref:Alpha,alpha-trehalose phosphorylase n=1 Tax=Pseudogracilibacillus auburnensis TaxID=1494959 RepID=A0A2V3VXK7_9BACI|nr:glycosyl hydrolase family 65 protein [Pseudogracilibacillus auburnensis]PXW86366.1 alpha,alpha-trehalose phosphorylase [Pseudogracilibacillus auburnensis]
MSWTIQSYSTDVEKLLLEESLFFTGNGYIGVRGNLEENNLHPPNTIRGAYVNGFYDDVPISYGEKMYAFPETQQKSLNITDTQTMEIWLGEGEWREKFSLQEGKVISYVRSLYVDKGYTERNIQWQSLSGHEIIINIKRLASFTTKNLFVQCMTLKPISGDIPIQVVSKLDGNVHNFIDPTDPRVGHDGEKRLAITRMEHVDDANYIELQTSKSNLSVATLTDLSVDNSDVSYEYSKDDTSFTTTATFLLTETTKIEKRTFFADSIRYDHLANTLVNLKSELASTSFEKIKNEQQTYLLDFWSRADICIKGDRKLQKAIRFNLFHILQSTGQDGISNIAAKGLSGEGYEGHYFWDTEIYLLPIFIMTDPDVAKKLLLYRYSILSHAKERAIEMGHKQGALFPWRTISGTECSSFFPAGTAQYHISADIAHSYIQYYLATNDLKFMKRAGAEVLIETARLWIDAGHYYDNSFRIDAVTGPDEYTCIVNNNYYTNVMAKQNLQWAVKVCHLLQKSDETFWEAFKERLTITEKELISFKCAAESMYLPIDKDLYINPQDDTFLQKKKWDFTNVPKEHYPLLLHYHPLTIYRYQVCKQADTVLAHLLIEEEQSEKVMKNSFHYYEKITSHDSSLSSCVFSMMAARIGCLEKAYNYFIQSASLDLDNTQGNTKDGLHMANMGGTWMGIVVGFAGMRLKESGLHFRPQLPKQWEEYSFHLQYQNRILRFTVSKADFHIELLKGSPLSIYVWGKEVIVNKYNAISMS